MSAEGVSFFGEMEREAEEKVPEVQSWQDYYKLRAREIETLLGYWNSSPYPCIFNILAVSNRA